MPQLVSAFEPSFVAPYTWALVVIVAIAVLRAALLSWRLIGRVRWRRVPLDDVLHGSAVADDLARAALANRVSQKSPSEESLAQVRADSRVDLDTALRTLRAADLRFDYLWRRLAVDVSLMRSLTRLALFAAAFMTVFGFVPSWTYFVVDNATDATIGGLPASNVWALFRALEGIRVRLMVGLGVAGGLCLVAMVFDGLLQQRLASWKYFCATVRNALSDGQPGE
jgi:hypothetical protein